MATPPQIDHVAINARTEMDRAQPAFAALGFQLTERGYHSLGSINHLMMFESDYLELIAVPPGKEDARPHIAKAPLGIDGLVFKTGDVDADHTHLQSLGMAGDPPNAFSRPVALPEGTREASFRTVHVRPGVFPAGRVYFCEHQTPELVWRPEWQSHANGARAMREVVVVAEDPAAEAQRFAQLLRTPATAEHDAYGIALAGSRITVLSPEAYGLRFGPLVTPPRGRSAWFGALALETASLAAVRAVLAAAGSGVVVHDAPDCVRVREPAFDTLLEFREAG